MFLLNKNRLNISLYITQMIIGSLWFYQTSAVLPRSLLGLFLGEELHLHQAGAPPVAPVSSTI